MDKRQQEQLDRYVEDLMNRYGAYIYTIALKKSSNRQDADDLTQEVFTGLYEHLRRHPGKQIDNPSSYLRRMVENEWNDLLRRRRSEQAHRVISLSSLERRDDEEGNAEPLEVVDGSLDCQPDLVAERNERTKRVTEEVKAISHPGRRQTMELHLAGCSDVEISAILGQPDGTTRGYRSQSQKILGPRLQDMKDEGI